jgi:thiamine biosynthesis lipoprotein
MADHCSEGRRSALRLSRRDFLRFAAGVSIAAWAGGLALEELEKARVVRQTRKLMGTVVNLTLVAPDRETAGTVERASSACLDRMAGLEAVLSRFRTDSQVSALNCRGSLPDPHPALLELVRQSHQISELSTGLFDITVLPVLALYQSYHTGSGGLPPADEIEAACRKVDYRKLAVSESELAFTGPGMGITLDGIAKGYIVDEGVARLREHGFTNVIVEAGGDLFAAGRPETNRPWQIGIRAPRGAAGDLAARLEVTNQAVATSGDYLQPFQADYSQHHILNPQTGRSASRLASATVIAPRLALADALATTLMLMDPAQGLDLIRRLGLRSILVTKDSTVLRS